MKKFLITISIIFCAVFANGCYFVFHGQWKATEKLNAGKKLNVYEIFSAYTMHTACWMFGWIISPEAAEQAFLMNFPHLRNGYVSRETDFFVDYDFLEKYVNKDGTINE